MRRESAHRIVLYVGDDPAVWESLKRSCPQPEYRVEQVKSCQERLQGISPSWRCECVVVVDHLEDAETAAILADLSRRDAGVPLIALVDREHPARLTAAGLARLHGVHRLVVKPWADRTELFTAVESAFDWLDHWKGYLNQPLSLRATAETPQCAAASFYSRPGSQPKVVKASAIP